ncbi:unnamed protein product [Phyllotreta striolata]|uniref:AAA+ ATPase domain-containing protein n=1 Tax=Phyllotreta striolata TaxID=444603 RepID=A0A9N9TXZ6_PHYSR|nr:unnamed protein product [Phyllotreta striolata]
MPYTADPSLIHKVQDYLETHTEKTYVDINEISDELQKKHREYANRKRGVFRAAVKKAYNIVLAKYGVEEDNSADNSDESSIDFGEVAENNSLNNQMVSLYKKAEASTLDVDENELIDISSDDESESQQNEVPSKQNAVNKNGFQPGYDSERTKKRSYATPANAQQQSKKRKVDGAPKRTVRDGEVTFASIGGMDKTLEEIAKLLLHIHHPEIYKTIGITPPRGFLLHGPPGCGKTMLAQAIAGELNVQLIQVTAPELVAGVSGESEQRIRNLFQRAYLNSPCILFIDEIDAITQNRQTAQKDMEKRMVAQLITCLDILNKSSQGNGVLVIGATNRPDSIDPALRRAGRFDREICLGIPNKESRADILKIVTKKLKLEPTFDYDHLASLTPGYVGADLIALTREAAMIAVDRMIRQLKEEEARYAEEEAEEEALHSKKLVQASKPVEETASSTNDKPEEAPDKDADSTEDLVVEDEPEPATTEKPPPVAATPELIVVIDEEKATPKKQPTQQPERSALEEILFWLHDQLPLSDEELELLCITMDDFRAALKHVQPSAKREGFVTVPDTTWDDVGSLKNIRQELQLSIVAPVRHPKKFESLGITVPAGVLLFGPPGCGKTLLAKAIANEAAINFISVKGPELLNMYVGESERAVRVVFERARNSAPCVIFFDELDALCPKRSSSDNNGTSRVVNQLLTEMDGVSGRKGVFLLAATNRIDIIDPAVLRPGRLDKALYVGLPSATDRAEILAALTKNGTKPRLAADVSLETIAECKYCEGFTGADLAALVREASVSALKDVLVAADGHAGDVTVNGEHFAKAFQKIRASVGAKDQRYYESMRRSFSSDRKDSEVEEMELI